jgi:LCP family protein required for cell wall assembly
MRQRQPDTPNLLDSLTHSHGKGTGAPIWGKILLSFLIFCIASGVYFSFHLATKVSRAFSAVTANSNQGLFQKIQLLANPPEKYLRGEEDDRINIVLLGVGGEGHEGANLADTIMVASFQPSTHRAALLSIPRDLVVEIPGYGYRKINHANAFGEEAGPPGAGAQLTREILTNVLGAPMQYLVRVDFRGFEKLIDDFGGVDVNVERSFVDDEYPTEDFGYQTIRFEAGQQHLNGSTALIFARSRHGTNNEGSDFARSKRQQKVLVALKEKILSVNSLLNPSRVADALDTLSQHIVTDFEPWELLKSIRFAQSIDTTTITSHVLDTTPEGLLVNTVGIDGAYLLEPRVKNYSEIRARFSSLLSAVPQQKLKLQIRNGTNRAGLAARVASLVESDEVEVVSVQNADRRDYHATTLYDLRGSDRLDVLARLRERTGATLATSLPAAKGNGSTLNTSDIGSSLLNGETLRTFTADPDLAPVDVVLILGSDQLERFSDL